MMFVPLLLQKGGMEYIKKESADVLCIQETKCTDKEIPVEELKEAGFSAHFLSGDKAGYSGIGIIYKKEPISITEGISMYIECCTQLEFFCLGIYLHMFIIAKNMILMVI